MQKITHAVTIREPYAFLIASGFKLAEIRSVPFPSTHALPTWVAIHASLSADELRDPDLVNDLADAHPEILRCWMLPLDVRPFGVSEIVGAMRVVATCPGENATSEQLDRLADAYRNRSERCRIDGWQPDEFVSDDGHNWVIDDVYRFHNRIVCGGNLGVWSLKSPALSMLVNKEFALAQKTGGLPRDGKPGKSIVYQLPKMPVKRQRQLGWVDAESVAVVV